ncbi:GFA family protein [Alteraurantiacibacter aquimixticola]|uniref:Aldehyde-activating protein n=1 Tax=Alteraurantiacibacter aquimixticola TaxID=2489173 RepID=A0A4T3EZV8_9SPHN|nr:GFA family protein [Alteraurantiacibacter aquimixticola]TIX50309.1 aldehyde-activating protein [Alteraurantiacibacter aquimixticola]
MKASCQCGALVASIDDSATPYVVACHCSDCRKRSGSPFGAMAYYPAATVRFAGEIREYSRPTDAGTTYTTGFCPACGSSITGKASRMPDIVGVAVGCFDDGEAPAPARSVYEQGKFGWVELPGEMTHHPQGRDT